MSPDRSWWLYPDHRGRPSRCRFTLHEDEGETYNYEAGKYSEIRFTWDDAAGQLTIGGRSGSHTGMPASRTFNVVWVGANHGGGVEVTADPDQVVKDDGSEVTVSAP
jgi:alpha-D-xyloside xylohydrolase